MNSHEFFLWLNGYLEALESEGITECKIQNIRSKMGDIKNRTHATPAHRPNVTPPTQQGYATPTQPRK